MQPEFPRNPKTVMTVVVFSLLSAGAFTLAAAMAQPTDRSASIRGVSEPCSSVGCVSPRQLITTGEAMRLKRQLGKQALIVDIRAAAEAPPSSALRSDVQAAFMEPAGASGMEFRTDFGSNVDDALLAAGMRHDVPVILMSPSPERAVLAALLLQEHGYSNILVIRD